jgi:hypothetical protein
MLLAASAALLCSCGATTRASTAASAPLVGAGVRWSGAPWYIEFAGRGPHGWVGTAGGGVSDFGSESSIKASLAQPRALLAASYASFGALGRKLDRSALDILTPAGRLLPLRRSIHFEPWGWSESLTGPGVTATGAAYTIAHNAFVFELHVNASRRVRIRFVDFSDPAIDASSETPLRNPPPGPTRIAGTPGADQFTVARTYGASLSGRAVTVWRTWRLFGMRYTGSTSGDGSFSAQASSPDEQRRFVVRALLGVGLTGQSAATAAANGTAKVGPNALSVVEHSWTAFLDGPARPPAGVGRTARQAYMLAMTALRMDLVAPVGRMRFPGTFPAKVSDTAFFGWDTPLNALGMSEWGGWQPSWLPRTGFTLAEDMILLQLQAQTPRGEICYFMTEDLRCQDPQWIQTPVQGWVAWRVAEHDPDRARALRFVRVAYGGLSRFYRYIIATHTGSDGRLQAYGAAETCDDSPRASLSDPPWTEIGAKQPEYEPIEYPVWMSAYATALGRMATELRRRSEAARWRADARAMTIQADGHWSAQVDGWLDRRAGVLVDVRTPLMWWPAALGTTLHPQWSREVLRRHALNPAEFARYTPVPLVAVNSRYYNHATHGSYCQGASWLLFAYGTLMALERAGFHAAADQLRARMITTAMRYGGIYENYDAMTGEPGYAPGLKLPIAFNYGHSATAIIEAIRRRD